jgi:hypothetical protein
LINLADQSVVAQTRTDPAGRYVFDVAGGLRTGRFAVQITPPAGLRPGLPPRPVAISGGDDFERYDIGLVPMFRVFVGGTSSDDQPLTSDPVAPKGGLPPKPMTPFAAGMI